MASYQMLPPGTKPTTTTVVFGRTYTAALGSVVAAVPEGDANQLEANGWIKVATNGSGTTAARPVNSNVWRNFHYFDSTLGYVVVYDGAAWRNPASGASV
jgi:protoporphyrinogen oxidase